MENNPDDFDFYEVMNTVREMEISVWLEEHPEVAQYIILDYQSSFRIATKEIFFGWQEIEITILK